MTKTRFRRIAPLLAALSLALVAVIPAIPAAAERQLALGVSMEPYTDMGQLDDFIRDTGRPPAIYQVRSAWGGLHANNYSRPFPSGLLNQVTSRGRIMPMVTWEPASASAPKCSDAGSAQFTFRKIINGVWDGYIRQWARDARNWGRPVIVRWAHEANGRWMPYSTQCRDNTPKRFRMAYRHIWNIFDDVGATNVKFLWSPNQPCKDCDPVSSLWPGAKYVDYMGLSSFNWSSPQPWKTMVKTFEPAMNALMRLSSKPIIVAETGSSHVGGNKADWITNGYPAVFRKWPQLYAVIYFNVDTRFMGQRDWRLIIPDEVNEDALQAYRAVLGNFRFQGIVN